MKGFQQRRKVVKQLQISMKIMARYAARHICSMFTTSLVSHLVFSLPCMSAPSTLSNKLAKIAASATSLACDMSSCTAGYIVRDGSCLGAWQLGTVERPC